MRSKIKAAALVLCAVLLVSGCKKKTLNNAQTDSSTVSSQPAASSAVESASSEVSFAESVPSAVSEPPAESTASAAPSKPAPVSKPEVKPAPAPVNPEDEKFMQLDNTRRGYGQGNAKDSANRPTGAVAAQERYEKYGAVFIAPPSNNVYLTFDLGYENGYTSKILDTLAEKNAKGIFFVTMGYCKPKAAQQIVERIIKEGHILGNHSVSHKSFPTLSVAEMKKEIQGLHDYIKTEYGYEMFLFRPPMGEYSIRSLAVAQSLGYKTMNWSFAYKDWDTGNQPDETWAKQKMLNDVHGGAVYLIHAVSKTNAAILGDVIDGIRAKGFEIAEYPR